MGSGAQIAGWKRGNLHEEATRTQAAQIGVEYDADEWTSGIVTNEDQHGRGGSLLFANVKVYHRVLIRASKTCRVRWNSLTSPIFTIRAGEPFEESRLEITKIFLTTTESTPIMVYAT